MYISVRVGDREYGGYPWEKYSIAGRGLHGNRKIQICFLNHEKERVYGPSWGEGEPTSNTDARLELTREGAKTLYRLLGDFLLIEGDYDPWKGRRDTDGFCMEVVDEAKDKRTVGNKEDPDEIE